MKKLIILICLFNFACTSKPEIIKVKLQAEELEVIKYTFPNHDIFGWKILEAPKFPPKGWHKTKGQRERFKKAIDSIKSNKSEKQIWFGTDTLFNPTNFRSGNKYYHDPRIKLDTIFFHLEKELFTIKYPKQAAKLDGLMFGNYVFASIDSIKKLNKIPKRYIAISRVVFNSNHTKASRLLAGLPHGAFLGGLPLAAGFGYTSPEYVGAGLAFCGFLFCLLLMWLHKQQPKTQIAL